MSASRRRSLLAVMLVVTLSASGCLTLNPTVSANTSDSTVFERLSATERLTGPGVRVNATLRSTPDASNVTTITVIKQNGRTYGTITVDPGQSTVILSLPANANATIVASNSVNSTTIDELNVTTGGDRLL